MKINVEFFKTGTTVYILTHSGITEMKVKDVDINSDGNIIYHLSSANNTFTIRLYSSFVYENPSDILSLIQSQIPKKTENETTETIQTEVVDSNAV